MNKFTCTIPVAALALCLATGTVGVLQYPAAAANDHSPSNMRMHMNDRNHMMMHRRTMTQRQMMMHRRMMRRQMMMRRHMMHHQMMRQHSGHM